MIKHLIDASGSGDATTCSQSSDCGKSSVCVIKKWFGASQFDTECRSASDGSCQCVAASTTDDEIVKAYLASLSTVII